MFPTLFEPTDSRGHPPQELYSGLTPPTIGSGNTPRQAADGDASLASLGDGVETPQHASTNQDGLRVPSWAIKDNAIEATVSFASEGVV